MPKTSSKPGGNASPPAETEESKVLIECSPYAMARFDRAVRYRYVNDAYERVTGVRRTEVMGRAVRETPAGEEYASFIETSVRRVFATGKEELAEIILGSRYYQSRFMPQYAPDGALESVILYADDITACKQAEEKLEKATAAAQAQAREVEQGHAQLKKMSDGIINTISKLVEMRDPYTAGHQRHVSQLACAIAKEMGLPEEQIEGIRIAGLIHDVGKLNVPVEILSKLGRLTRIEFNIIKIHPTAGYEILRGIDFPWPVAEVAHQHQERIDGSGYPQGLKGEQILLEARIVTVADVVEAMAFRRPYREVIGLDKALEQIARGRGLLYDRHASDVCLKLFRENKFHFIDH